MSDNIFFQDASEKVSLFSNMPKFDAEFDSVFFWDFHMHCFYSVIAIVQEYVMEIYVVLEGYPGTFFCKRAIRFCGLKGREDHSFCLFVCH